MRPTDQLIAESREIVQRLRKQFPDPVDFEHTIKEVIVSVLRKDGATEKAIKTTIKAVFGGD